MSPQTKVLVVVGVYGAHWSRGVKKREHAETAPTLSPQHAQQQPSMGDKDLDPNNNLQKPCHVLVLFAES